MKTQRTPRVSLNTTAKARAYLESRGVSIRESGETCRETCLVNVPGCGRCGGTGNVGIYWRDGGVCYLCNGAKTGGVVVRTIVSVARQERTKELREAKREAKRLARVEKKLEGQRRWCEANGYGRLTFAEKDAKQAAEIAGAHVGVVGERSEFEVYLERVSGFTRESWSGRGTEYVNVFAFRTIGDGSAISCFTTSDLDGVGVGEICTIRATVKKHGDYRGEPQTTVNRVKVLPAIVC